MENFVPVGRVQKTFGSNGELLIQLYDGQNIILDAPYFIEIEGLFVPFFVKKASPRGAKYIVVFEGILYEEFAKELVGTDLLIKGSEILQTPKKYLHPLMGYSLHSETDEFLGTITDWLEVPNNPLLQVTSVDDEDILIPDNANFILKINKASKIVIMQLPVGLFTINKHSKRVE
ncbi:MAG: ribosome maturation factor RimM [Bacteroidales bacterium]